jgi:hypothetical protein
MVANEKGGDIFARVIFNYGVVVVVGGMRELVKNYMAFRILEKRGHCLAFSFCWDG